MRIRNEQQRQRRAAFTLMEMLVVVAIIVALAGIGGFFLMDQLKGGQKDAARAQVTGPLTQACQAYYIKNSSYPDNLRQLLGKDSLGNGPYLESEDALRDPWGNEYQYDKAGTRNNTTKPDIWTKAPSDDVLIGNWPKGR